MIRTHKFCSHIKIKYFILQNYLDLFIKVHIMTAFVGVVNMWLQVYLRENKCNWLIMLTFQNMLSQCKHMANMSAYTSFLPYLLQLLKKKNLVHVASVLINFLCWNIHWKINFYVRNCYSPFSWFLISTCAWLG